MKRKSDVSKADYIIKKEIYNGLITYMQCLDIIIKILKYSLISNCFLTTNNIKILRIINPRSTYVHLYMYVFRCLLFQHFLNFYRKIP